VGIPSRELRARRGVAHALAAIDEEAQSATADGALEAAEAVTIRGAGSGPRPCSRRRNKQVVAVRAHNSGAFVDTVDRTAPGGQTEFPYGCGRVEEN
jgi:hypothetical protein